MAKTKDLLPPQYGESPSDPKPDIMTASEVAAYLRLSSKTVYVLARSGEIPCRIIGNNFRFSRRAIEAML